MAIEYNFTLDMDRSKRDNNIAYARTGDVDSITINADLVLNGSAYTPSGTNAFFECITPNGHSVRAAAEKSGSSVSVEVPSAAFQAAGVINVAYFRFESGDADNPTYVESTEPFAIVVREGIGDSIDAGDYIEEWRQLADYLGTVVADVEKKAEQAETAINEQKTEVDQLKAQAQTAIAGDVTDVEEAAQSAISAINQEKADVADAAEDISAAGEQAISTFNTNSQQAINQFNTNADGKLEEVDGMITEAQGDVDAAITQLENKTQDAIEAAQDALDGTIATNLQNAINRTVKLDVADMINIPDNSSLSSFTNVGSYCCKTAATAATIGDCPIDDSPFNMYVFSSSTSGQVMQLVVPIDHQGKPTTEWHVRFGTSSAMDPWSVIGGGADIAAGLGIDVSGDAQKIVALDTSAFYQHHEATSVIQGFTEVTGGGRIKELTVFGNTRQNLWVNPSGISNGVTSTSNDDGSFTMSGTATKGSSVSSAKIYSLKPGTKYTASIDNVTNGFSVRITESTGTMHYFSNGNATFTTDEGMEYCAFILGFDVDATPTGTYRVMLNEGPTAEPWCPPGLNGVDELSVVTAGKNILPKNISEHKYDINIARNFDMCGLTVGDEFSFRVFVDGNEYSDGVNVALYGIKADGSTSMTVTPSASQGGKGVVADGTVSLRFFNTAIAGATLGSSTVQTIMVRGHDCPEYLPSEREDTTIDLDGHTLNSLPDGTRDELTVDASGRVTLTKRVGMADKNTDWVLGTQQSGTVRSNVADALSILEGDFVAQGFKADRSTGVVSNWADYTAGIAAPSTGLFQVYVKTVDGNNLAASKQIISNLDGKFLYAIAAPQEVELPSITLPELASPDYTVFSNSNVPAEIEVEVVKVDYLPAPDVYTKEEVDQKIEDAGGMPDIVPVSQGGTGVTTAAAERNRLGLGNTTGALPVANGGTGAANAKAAQYSLLGMMNEEDTEFSDNTTTVFAYSTGTNANGAVYKRKMSTVWTWIASKIRRTFGFNASNVLPVENGGTGATTAKGAREAIGAGTSSFSGSYDDLTDKPSIPSVPISVADGGTGATIAADARTNLDVYSKSETDGKIPKVVYGIGNIPDDAEPGTIYINYSE